MPALLPLLMLHIVAAPPADALDQFLQGWADRYSEAVQMVETEFQSPGYHSQIKSGTRVHPVLAALDYALGLYQRGRPDDVKRAELIVARVLTLQDTDPAHKTYGIWPWLLEEPLERMAPPDWNWADFCGARLAILLADHAKQLPDPLRENVRAALGHAARAIEKRNVVLSYTNIAIMGGGVCAAAGELLGDAHLLDYGRKRLQGVVEHTAKHGGFNEYNSPTYTMVALVESERTLHLVRDEATRQAAESLRQTAWKTIAESFHPATAQWAGPHARSYSDYIFPRTAALLSTLTGAPIVPHAKADANRATELPVSWHLPCPAQWQPRFRQLPVDPCVVRRQFIASPSGETIGTTWFSGDACLGSINRGSFWTQCRPVLGYWRTEADSAVVLRVRFLHDGRDFASMGLRTAQADGRCLVAVHPLRNQGDWHPGLDRPADGQFAATDFRLRVELVGKGVTVEPRGPGRWALRAGQHEAVVYAPACRFDEVAVAWKTGATDTQAQVDAVCYEGPTKKFDFKQLPTMALAFGLEVRRIGDDASRPMPVVESLASRRVQASWPGETPLSVEVDWTAAKK